MNQDNHHTWEEEKKKKGNIPGVLSKRRGKKKRKFKSSLWKRSALLGRVNRSEQREENAKEEKI